jgi:hypothetical protein
VLAARQIRRRYTALDLAAETGVLESLLVSLAEPTGKASTEAPPGTAA